MQRTQKIASLSLGLVGLLVVTFLGFAGFDLLRQVFLVEENPVATQPSQPVATSLADEGVVITFAAFDYEQGMYQSIIDAFHTQYPEITVQFVALPDDAFNSEVGMAGYYRTVASAADTTVINPWDAGLVGSYFRPVEALLDADPAFDTADFWPGMLSACQDGSGQAYGIPLNAAWDGIFFDRDAFVAAGIPQPAPGWTWDDFRSAVVALAQDHGDQVLYGYADVASLSGSILEPLVDQRLAASGGELEPQTLAEALAWYIDLAQAEAIYPVRSTEDWEAEWNTWQGMFQSAYPPAMWAGSVAAPMPGTELSVSVEGNFENAAFRSYGFAPFPIGSGEDGGNTTPGHVTCAGISAGSDQPRAAWTWIDFLSRQRLLRSGPQAYDMLKTPARRSVAQSSGYWETLPAEVEPSIRFALDHAWYGSLYPAEMQVIEGAVLTTLAGDQTLTAALSAVEISSEAAPEVPAANDGGSPIVVATPQPTPRPDTMTIRFHALPIGAEEESVMKSLVEEFHQSHPDIQVRLTNFDFPFDDPLHILTALAGQFDCFTWYAPHWETDREEVEYLLSLSPYFDAEGADFVQDFYASQLDAYRYDGELWGMPAISQPVLIMYNADLLARRGLQPPSPDWTFDDFIALASAAASTTEDDRTYGFLLSEATDLFFIGRGEHWADLDMEASPRQAVFDVQGMTATLSWFEELASSGVLRLYDPFGSQWRSMQREFEEGRIAFWIGRAGAMDYFQLLDGIDLPYTVGMVPPPTFPDQPGQTYGSSWDRGYYISRQTESPQACWTWLKFLSDRTGLFDGVPARRSIAESPAWETSVGPEEAAVYRLALEQVHIHEYDHFAGPIYVARNEAAEAVLKGTDPEAAVAEAQRKVDEYLACMADVASDDPVVEVLQTALTCSKGAGIGQ